MLHTLVHRLARRSWIVSVATVAICAAFAARAAASLVAAHALVPEQAVSAGRSRSPRPPGLVADAGERRRAEADRLVARDPFCSACSPPSSAAGPAAELALPAVLIATSRGAASSATVRVLASEAQGSWAVGDTVPGLGQLVRIGPTSVDLVDPRGHRGRLSLRTLLEPAAGDGPGSAKLPAAPAASRWSAQITRLDDQRYIVDRDLVRGLVNGATRSNGVRVVPILEHGEIQGLRLFGVTATSIPAALGLRSGDKLTAIDGEPIRNLQQLLDLYTRLDQLSGVELSGSRGATPIVRTLQLR